MERDIGIRRYPADLGQILIVGHGFRLAANTGQLKTHALGGTEQVLVPCYGCLLVHLAQKIPGSGHPQRCVGVRRLFLDRVVHRRREWNGGVDAGGAFLVGCGHFAEYEVDYFALRCRIAGGQIVEHPLLAEVGIVAEFQRLDRERFQKDLAGFLNQLVVRVNPVVPAVLIDEITCLTLGVLSFCDAVRQVRLNGSFGGWRFAVR